MAVISLSPTAARFSSLWAYRAADIADVAEDRTAAGFLRAKGLRKLCGYRVGVSCAPSSAFRKSSAIAKPRGCRVFAESAVSARGDPEVFAVAAQQVVMLHQNDQHPGPNELRRRVPTCPDHWRGTLATLLRAWGRATRPSIRRRASARDQPCLHRCSAATQ